MEEWGREGGGWKNGEEDENGKEGVENGRTGRKRWMENGKEEVENGRMGKRMWIMETGKEEVEMEEWERGRGDGRMGKRRMEGW